MPRIFPFEGLVYDRAVAGPLTSLTAPPYDVISDPRRARLLEASAYNIVRLDLAEGPEDPAHPSTRYERAAGLLASWRRAGVLARAPSGYFAYEMRGRLGATLVRTRGLFCAMALEPWGGSILPHEATMPGPVADRLRLLRATRTHLSAVYGTIAGPRRELATLLDDVTERPPSLEVEDEEGITHRMWPIPGDLDVARWLGDERLLIADGHHRYTTALAYRDERHATDGPGPWDRILTLIVDAAVEDVHVLPYHRVQLSGDHPLGGRELPDLDALVAALEDDPPCVGIVAVSADGAPAYRLLELRGGPPAVRALHAELLDGTVPDDALRFTHDAADADAAVRRGDAALAYLLPPTTPARIRGVVDRGERLPRKSTFFWPKPRTGMVLMPLEP